MELAASWAAKWSWPQAPPSPATFQHILKRSRPSRPGPDSLPFVAWDAAGPEAIDTLWSAGAHAAAGGFLSISFNNGEMVFAPKGLQPTDLLH
eukprot:4388543-Lingulodinium_polyedra.AAC.1